MLVMIQRTEIYEYAKVLGNPQYILLPFQAYKLIYAQMLVEAGKTAEAFRYALPCRPPHKTFSVRKSSSIQLTIPFAPFEKVVS